MGEQLQLVLRMKPDEITGSPPAAEEPTHTLIREYPLDEVFAQRRIVEASLVLDWEVRQPLQQRLRKEAPAGPRLRRSAIHAHARQPATRRVFLEDVTGEIGGHQVAYPTTRVTSHVLGPVSAAGDADQTHALGFR